MLRAEETSNTLLIYKVNDFSVHINYSNYNYYIIIFQSWINHLRLHKRFPVIPKFFPSYNSGVYLKNMNNERLKEKMWRAGEWLIFQKIIFKKVIKVYYDSEIVNLHFIKLGNTVFQVSSFT